MGLLSPLRYLKSTIGTDNERLREQWLRQTLSQVPAGGRILDAGAGTQRYKPYCTHLEYVSQDFAAYDGSGNQKGLQMGEFDYGVLDIVSDITAIPRPNASFDALMCIEVLEHLPNPIGAVAEFSRLLRPGGLLVMTAPFCSFTHFAPYHFSTGFNRYWYERHLADLGFDILELEPSGSFFDFVAQELRRVPDTSKRYAGKRPGWLDLLGLALSLRCLARVAPAGRGSAEFACYGYHVMARRHGEHSAA